MWHYASATVSRVEFNIIVYGAYQEIGDYHTLSHLDYMNVLYIWKDTYFFGLMGDGASSICRFLILHLTLRYADIVHTKLTFQVASASLKAYSYPAVIPSPQYPGSSIFALIGYGMLFIAWQLPCHVTIRPTSSGLHLSAD